MSAISITSRASVPIELANAWLQHLRNFDAAHPGCHFQVWMASPDETTIDEVLKMLTVDPPIPVIGIVPRKE